MRLWRQRDMEEQLEELAGITPALSTGPGQSEKLRRKERRQRLYTARRDGGDLLEEEEDEHEDDELVHTFNQQRGNVTLPMQRSSYKYTSGSHRTECYNHE